MSDRFEKDLANILAKYRSLQGENAELTRWLKKAQLDNKYLTTSNKKLQTKNMALDDELLNLKGLMSGLTHQ